MKYIPQDKKNRQIFTHRLSHVMLLIVVAYIISNIIVIRNCEIQYLSEKTNNLCNVAEIFSPLSNFIPVIYKPVKFLEDRGDKNRANLVIAAYSFSWSSFLIFAVMMATVAFVRVKMLSDKDRDIYINWSIKKNKEIQQDKNLAANINLGTRTILCISAVLFIYAFLGFLVLMNIAILATWSIKEIEIYMSLLFCYLLF